MMLLMTRALVEEKLLAYLNQEVTRAELVEWAETTLLEADLDEADAPLLRDIIGRLGVADVREFGLTWDDCVAFIKQLGYRLEVRAVAAQ
jgi:hypothetical protein